MSARKALQSPLALLLKECGDLNGTARIRGGMRMRDTATVLQQAKPPVSSGLAIALKHRAQASKTIAEANLDKEMEAPVKYMGLPTGTQRLVTELNNKPMTLQEGHFKKIAAKANNSNPAGDEPKSRMPTSYLPKGWPSKH